MVAGSVAVLLVSAATAPPAGAAVSPGSTVRASVHDGTNAQSPNGGDSNAISADGNSLAFVSNSRLDDLDNGEGERVPYRAVYVRDFRTNRTVMLSRGQFTEV